MGTGVKLDACVNNVDGLRGTALLASAVADPAIIPLVLVVKARLSENIVVPIWLASHWSLIIKYKFLQERYHSSSFPE